MLDADVLYPFLVRDILLSLAEAGLFQARWSQAIMDEWQRNLLAARPDRRPQVVETARIMAEAFPEAMVDDFDALIDSIDLPDPDDRHVVAAAITAGAQLVVTNNARHFPTTALAPHGIAGISPDDLVVDLLKDGASDVVEALCNMRLRYSRPSFSAAEMIAAIAKAGMTKTAMALRPHTADL